jgi:outer membrane protein
MKLKPIIFCFTVGFLKPMFCFADATEVKYDSLKKLLEARNVKLESLRFETDAAKLREGYLGRSFLPSLELNAGQETFKKGLASQKTQPAYGIEAKVNLYNGGKDSIESDIRQLNSEKRNVIFQRISAEELLEARVLYWEILYLQEKAELLAAMSKVNSQNSESALRRIRGGVATESDKMEFEIKAVNLTQDIENTQLQTKIKLSELQLVLGLDPHQQIHLPKTIGHEHNFENAINHSMEDHDILHKEAELDAKILQLSSQSLKRNWFPKIDAVAGYNQFNEREEDYPEANQRTESFIGLHLSLSLAEGLDSGRQAEAHAKESMAHTKRAELQKKQVHAHVENEVAELKLLHSQVHDAEENIQRAEKYYKLTQSEYARGVKNSLDMLSASEKIFEVKNRRLEILKDFNLKQAHVLAKINK